MSGTHLTDAIKFCPACGKQNLESLGTVFIEDGPWDGRCYVNEGDWERIRCLDCQFVFGPMPTPMTCKCGEYVGGEVGEECDQDPENEDEFLCETCMKAGGPNE